MAALHHNLTKDKCYVNGEWVTSNSGLTFDVYNPSNGQLLGKVPDMDEVDAHKAIKAATEAFKTWQTTTAKERSDCLRRWFELVKQNQDELAKVLTAEQGKTLAEARTEVAYGASFLEWYSEEARRIYGEVAQSPTKSKEMIFIRQPIGVVGLITPWNFPNAMLTRKAAAAIAAGCTCVAKPAEDTPYSALALAQLAEEANIPRGVFNVITSSVTNTPKVGRILCENPDVAGVSFTGSTAVGKILYQQCASTVKRVSLELGGNAAFIIFNSAKLEKAINGAIACKFRGTGQTCVSANRILVQSGIYEEFVAKFKQAVLDRSVVGDGFDSKVTQGPLANKKQALKVDSLVKDAISHGAKCELGGKAHKLGELFYEPTILTNIDNSMQIYHEEIFGPVASIIKYAHFYQIRVIFEAYYYGINLRPLCNEKKRFNTEEEAINIANSSNKGLAGYFYTEDISQAWRVAKKLESGMVGINEGILSAAEACFGGVKESGIGREGSRHGIDEYTYIKYLCFGGLE